jgi:hypothetical protein
MTMSGEIRFVQIATSSAVVAERLYTVVNALDEEGGVWQYQPEEKSRAGKGIWVRLSTDRK